MRPWVCNYSRSYSASHDSPENKAFVARFKAINQGMRPNIVSVSVWDVLELIYRALEKTKGDTNGDALFAAIKVQSFNSPRGPISIDPGYHPEHLHAPGRTSRRRTL
jgi:branched-chain amino acid transport system substrate-binding protein